MMRMHQLGDLAIFTTGGSAWCKAIRTN